jgi:hypothetical protein
MESGHATASSAADRLAANAGVFRALLETVPAEQARWRPDSSQWSMLEVVNHLADEEVEDFRRRLELTLRDPRQPWPPIDPQGWATARGYNDRRLDASLARFVDERARSVEWLRTLGRLALDRAHEHPALGPLRAGDLLHAWLAHDLIHVRQLTRLHYRWLERSAAPYRLDYAGPF